MVAASPHGRDRSSPDVGSWFPATAQGDSSLRGSSESRERGPSMSGEEISRHVSPPHTGPGSALLPYLEELLAVCTVYTGDAERATGLLSGVLPDIVAQRDGDDRVACHRAAYRAAEADGTVRPVTSGRRLATTDQASRLERALAGLSLPTRAATVLVDVAELRYDDVAAVMDSSASDVARLVASGRRGLRRSLGTDGRGRWARPFQIRR
jgi:hypothetical protein